MDLMVFDRQELPFALRALKAIARENGVFTDAERDFVEAVAQLHGVDVDVDALELVSPEEVARAIESPHHRKRAVQLALVMALVEGDPDAGTERAVAELATALGVSDGGLEVLREVAGGHRMLARFDMVRRVSKTIPKDVGFLDVALPLLGLGEDPSLAARYRALGDLPAGTLGHAFHTHFVEHGFALPGERGGMPEKMLFHDIGHVLSGYDVDPQGEIQQAAFQAGFMRKDGFTFLLFGVLQFHIGLRVTPIAKAQKGFFDPKKVLRAAARGAACTVDLSEGFDLWAVADQPLAAVRERLGIPALA